MIAIGNSTLGPFDPTVELRQSQPPYRHSTQSRPTRESQNSRANKTQPTCPPQKPPTTLLEAQNARDALARQSDNLDRLIAHGARLEVVG